MTLQNISNCPTCGKLFVKGLRDVCPECHKKVEDQYDTCLQYLREHKSCTMYELSDATGVSVKQITRFIREGRISLAHAPNMSYPCEVCGTPIREHNMCDPCRNKLTKDVKNLTEDEKRRQEQKEADVRLRYNIEDRLKDRR